MAITENSFDIPQRRALPIYLKHRKMVHYANSCCVKDKPNPSGSLFTIKSSEIKNVTFRRRHVTITKCKSCQFNIRIKCDVGKQENGQTWHVIIHLV